MALKKTDRITRRVGTDRYRAIEVYECPKAEALGHEEDLWLGRVPFDLTGCAGVFFKPEPVEIHIQKGYPRLTKAHITVKWESLDWRRYIVRHPSAGVVFIKTSLGVSTPKTDVQGRTIHGIDPGDLTGRTTWEIVKGKVTVPAPRAIYRIYAAIHYASRRALIHQMAQKVGYVSRTTMSHFGYFANAGESRLAAMYVAPDLGTPGIGLAAYDFACIEGGWRHDQESRRFDWRVLRQPIYDVETPAEATGAFATTLMRVPTTTTRNPDNYPVWNFQPLNNLCNWYL